MPVPAIDLNILHPGWEFHFYQGESEVFPYDNFTCVDRLTAHNDDGIRMTFEDHRRNIPLEDMKLGLAAVAHDAISAFERLQQ